MIRPLNDKHGRMTSPNITPPDPAAVARLDEILRDTAGMWATAEGERIERYIADLRDTPERNGSNGTNQAR